MIIKNILKHKINFIIKVLALSILLGFTATLLLVLSNNSNKSYAEMLLDNQETFVQIEKVDCDEDLNCFQQALTEDDEKNIEAKLNQPYYEVYRANHLSSYLDSSYIFKLNSEYDDDNMYSASLDVDIVVTNNFDELIQEEIIGRYPEKDNEILIPNYIADLMIILGLTTYENEFYYPSSYDDILNEYNNYYFGDSGRVRIVGIINYDLSKYEDLKKCYYGTNENLCDGLTHSELVDMTRNRLNKIYVLPSFINSASVNFNGELDLNDYSYEIIDEDVPDKSLLNIIGLKNVIEYYNGISWIEIDTLNEDEIILNIYQLVNDKDAFEESLAKYFEKHPNRDKEELEKEFLEDYVSNIDIIGNEITFKIVTTDGEVKEEKKLKVIGISTFHYGNTVEHYYISNSIAENYQLKSLQKTGYLISVDENNMLEILDEYLMVDNYIVETSYTETYLNSINNLNTIKSISTYITVIIILMIIYLTYSFSNYSVIQSKKIEYCDKGKVSTIQNIILISLSSIVSILFMNNFLQGINNFISTQFNWFELSNSIYIILIILDIIILFIVYIISKIKISNNLNRDK